MSIRYHLKISKWKAPDPEFRTVHEMRKLRMCCFCKDLGMSLLVLEADRRSKPGVHTHGYCLAVKKGLDVLLTLPATELGKVTLSEMVALGLTKVWLKICRDAEERDAKLRTAEKKKATA